MRYMKKGCIIFAVLFLGIGSAFAEDKEAIKEEIRMLKERISRLEERLAKYETSQHEGGEGRSVEGEIKKDILEGLSISGGITTVYQATYNANGNSSPKEDSNTLVYSADLEFEKVLSDQSKVFLHLETGDGGGVDGHLQVFSPVNSDANDENSDVSVSEVWYEYTFDSIPVVFTAGKLDPTAYVDTNEYANDECSQFLGGIFKNSPVIEFPDNSVGIHISVEPSDVITADLVIVNPDADNDDAFSKMFFAAQIGFRTDIFQEEGNYRLIVWMNGNNHTRWDDSSDTDEESYGVGVSFDQQITTSSGVFFRYGWQRPAVYLNGEDFSLEHSFSFGFQVKGSVWSRQNDVFAIAFGELIPSDDYKKYSGRSAKSEKHIEAYYNCRVNDNVSFTPDIQIIWNPYGNDAARGDDTIVVGGIRMQVDF